MAAVAGRPHPEARAPEHGCSSRTDALWFFQRCVIVCVQINSNFALQGRKRPDDFRRGRLHAEAGKAVCAFSCQEALPAAAAARTAPSLCSACAIDCCTYAQHMHVRSCDRTLL